jgi:signal transduction histidine kinase
MKAEEVAKVASSISSAYENDDADLAASIQKLSISNDFYVMMESSKGVLLFLPEPTSNFPVSAYMDDAVKLKNMLKNSEGEPVSFKINTGIENYRTIAYGAQITGSNGETVNIYIFSPLYPVSSTISILRHQFFYITFAIIILGLILAIVFARRISRPLKMITDSAEEMGKGNYGVKFETNSFSEINNLANTLNTTCYELGMADNRLKDLIANVSHDLKTPLTMIRSYAEMIQDLSGDNPEKRKEHLQVIIDETNRLSRLVSDMATISAMQTHKTVLDCTTFDLRAAAISILSSYKILAEQKGYHFIFDAPKECFAYGDEAKIKQVIANLVSNAVKYCGEDNVVILKINRTGKKYIVKVTDHGPGISSQEIPHVWDRYYKTSTNYVRPTEGTGLGLSIVKEILTLHHTNYGVASRLGKGTTFWFELPLMKKMKPADKDIPIEPESIKELQ